MALGWECRNPYCVRCVELDIAVPAVYTMNLRDRVEALRVVGQAKAKLQGRGAAKARTEGKGSPLVDLLTLWEEVEEAIWNAPSRG